MVDIKKYGKQKKSDDFTPEERPTAPPRPEPEPPDEDKQFGTMITTKMPECDQKNMVKLKILYHELLLGFAIW